MVIQSKILLSVVFHTLQHKTYNISRVKTLLTCTVWMSNSSLKMFHTDDFNKPSSYVIIQIPFHLSSISVKHTQHFCLLAYWKGWIIFLACWPFLKPFTHLQMIELLPCYHMLFFTCHRRCHEKTSYVLNYAIFTLLHKWVDRGQTHHFEKLQ